MSEIEDLRKQLEEEQRRRRAAEGHALEQQSQREEEQRRREEEQRRREEEQRRREEEQRRREEEQRRREEEQRRREAAEERASASQPLTLHRYLETCHSLDLAIDVVTDRSLTTQGDTTNPTGRIYPQRILPWATFSEEQESIWNELSFSPSFSSQPVFPSRHQLDYVRSLLRPVSSEIGLRNGARDVVENAVQKLVDATHADAALRHHLGLDGTVTFESHTNLGFTDESLSESMKSVSIGPGTSHRTNRRRKARGKGNRADQFCIYRTSDDRNTPAIAIEYKAPHKLRRSDIVTGLVSEIQPDSDVINQEGEGYPFAARRLATAVVTQLFSYMIGKGIQYGYVCTGEAYVFLHIPDDPSCVYFSVSVPSLDVDDNDDNRLHRTAVAQVFAFVLQAIRSPPPSQAWHDAAERLNTWSVEYEDVLRSIPATDRKPTRETPYKPQRWKGFVRSPIRTRSRCLSPQDGAQHGSGEESDSDDQSPSPTPNPTSSQARTINVHCDVASGETQKGDGGVDSQQGTRTRQNIRDRPYCTQECLRGLAFGGALDKRCPNLMDHGNAHASSDEFLCLAQHQLAVDRGKDADCVPLYISGSRGSLFKFRLSSHGYTLVAKGVENMDAERLRHESKMYDHVTDLQGHVVPVCLGIIALVKPYYYDSGVFEHFLFLGYGGRPVVRAVGEVNKSARNKVVAALGRLHQYGLLHRDAEPRNVLYDERTREYMVVDLMLAEMRGRRSLKPINVNSQNRKRKWSSEKHEKDPFTVEMHNFWASLSR